MDTVAMNRIGDMECDIVDMVRSTLGDDLVSLLVVGSYATYDVIDGYSDYDLLALVDGSMSANGRIDLHELSDRYGIGIGCVVRPLADVLNRIDENDRATRYVGNLDLIDLKIHARLLCGQNVAEMIPDTGVLIRRDFRSELQAQYRHAVDHDPEKDIFRRGPRDWCNYIINLCGALLLSKGVTAEKRMFPRLMRSHHPDFRAVPLLEEALALRESRKALGQNESERETLRESLALFLEEYRRYTFQ